MHAVRMRPILSQEQQEVVCAAMAGKNVFLTGNAGCGKTVTLRSMIDSFETRYGRQFRRYVAVCAPTGVAATHIGGRTYHSRLGVGVIRRSSDFPSLLKKRSSQDLRELRVLILDEISMVSAEMFECLSWFLGQIRKRPDLPFGGVQVIVSGDFYQICPISTDPSRNTLDDAFLNRGYAFQAPAWRRCRFEAFHLRRIWRQSDANFTTLLNEIKEGSKEALEELLRLCARPLTAHHAILPTELFGTNQEAEGVNARAMEGLTGPVVELPAMDSIHAPRLSKEGKEKWMQCEFFRECPAPATLCLKEGAQVMLVKNLEFDGGSQMLVNGSRGVVVAFQQKNPIVEFCNGRVEVIEVAEFSQEIADGVTAIRKQIPLKLAWGITQMKSQGMTLDCARVSLDRIFAPGQAYVALSRVRDAPSLEIMCGSKRPNIDPSPEVTAFYKNIQDYDPGERWATWMKEHPIPFLEESDVEPSRSPVV